MHISLLLWELVCQVKDVNKQSVVHIVLFTFIPTDGSSIISYLSKFVCTDELGR